MGVQPFAIIPTTTADWTAANIAALKAAGFAAFDPNFVELWLNGKVYEDAAPINGPIRVAPMDATRAFQPFAMRPSAFPQGPSLTFAVDAAGRAIAENLTADTSGGNVGQNPPETFRQPGTGAPALTTEILGGASFQNFMLEYGGHFAKGVAKFVWGSLDGIYSLNFSTALPLRQLPVAYNVPGIGSYPYTWPRDVIPFITDDYKVGVVKVEDVKKLGKFDAPASTAPAAIQYRNDGAATAAVIAALQAAGFTGTALGDAVNKTARMVL